MINKGNHKNQNMNTEIKKKINTDVDPYLKGFYKFFCWCSGARLYLLRRCPSDFNKYFGIGAVVFLTGVLAAISGGYALYTVFSNLLTSIIFGIFWGILIFTIDWYIVSSLKKQNKPFNEVLSSLPRLVLAVLLAVVISTPLKLKLFEKEINAELETFKSDRALNYTNIVFKEFDELSNLKKENSILQAQIDTKQEQRDLLFTMIIDEAEGRSPTNTPGKGPVYKEKKAQLDKIEMELEHLRKRNLAQMEIINTQIAELRKERKDQIDKGNSANRQYDGLLARMEALSAISMRNETINLAGLFFLILFIVIEASPILVKLMSKRGPYDELLDLEEYKKEVDTKREMSKIKLNMHDYINIAQDTRKMKTDANQYINEIMINKIKKTQTKINDLKIKKWEEEQLKHIVDNGEDIMNEVKSITNMSNETLQEDN